MGMTDKENLKIGLEEVSDFFFEMYRKETDEYKAAKAKEYCDIAEEALAALKEQPEIVRCKDCKHATMTSDGKLCKYCAMDTDDFGNPRDVYHDADWFCADGERQDSNG